MWQAWVSLIDITAFKKGLLGLAVWIFVQNHRCWWHQLLWIVQSCKLPRWDRRWLRDQFVFKLASYLWMMIRDTVFEVLRPLLGRELPLDRFGHGMTRVFWCNIWMLQNFNAAWKVLSLVLSSSHCDLQLVNWGTLTWTLFDWKLILVTRWDRRRRGLAWDCLHFIKVRIIASCQRMIIIDLCSVFDEHLILIVIVRVSTAHLMVILGRGPSI